MNLTFAGSTIDLTPLGGVYDIAPLITDCYGSVALQEAIAHDSNHHLQDIMAAVATLL